MKSILKKILKIIRFIYRSISKKKFDCNDFILDRQIANDIIYELLSKDSPCMIARYGSTEMGTLLNYICINKKDNLYIKLINYIKDDIELPWWDESHLKPMEIWSGVFPISYDLCNRFSVRYLEDSPYVDLLGSFHYSEKFMPLKKNIIKVHLESLYPFFVENPWTRILEGKNVLVVHPFAKTISDQYKNRENLFSNKNVLPNFNLIVLPAVQSIGGEIVPYKDWFEALHFMEEQIKLIDFDFCLLGCGAYGLPLAAYIKRLGKKSIHLGGGLQLLFGIKGKRWDNDYKWDNLPDDYDTNYNKLYNNYWVRPNAEETPLTSVKVENSCYW
jgi:hypothetical protein